MIYTFFKSLEKNYYNPYKIFSSFRLDDSSIYTNKHYCSIITKPIIINNITIKSKFEIGFPRIKTLDIRNLEYWYSNITYYHAKIYTGETIIYIKYGKNTDPLVDIIEENKYNYDKHIILNINNIFMDRMILLLKTYHPERYLNLVSEYEKFSNIYEMKKLLVT